MCLNLLLPVQSGCQKLWHNHHSTGTHGQRANHTHTCTQGQTRPEQVYYKDIWERTKLIPRVEGVNGTHCHQIYLLVGCTYNHKALVRSNQNTHSTHGHTCTQVLLTEITLGSHQLLVEWGLTLFGMHALCGGGQLAPIFCFNPTP